MPLEIHRELSQPPHPAVITVYPRQSTESQAHPQPQVGKFLSTQRQIFSFISVWVTPGFNFAHAASSQNVGFCCLGGILQTGACLLAVSQAPPCSVVVSPFLLLFIDRGQKEEERIGPKGCPRSANLAS